MVMKDINDYKQQITNSSLVNDTKEDHGLTRQKFNPVNVHNNSLNEKETTNMTKTKTDMINKTTTINAMNKTTALYNQNMENTLSNPVQDNSSVDPTLTKKLNTINNKSKIRRNQKIEIHDNITHLLDKNQKQRLLPHIPDHKEFIRRASQSLNKPVKSYTMKKRKQQLNKSIEPLVNSWLAPNKCIRTKHRLRSSIKTHKNNSIFCMCDSTKHLSPYDIENTNAFLRKVYHIELVAIDNNLNKNGFALTTKYKVRKLPQLRYRFD